ncbi:uncharacterized protein ACOB8E_014691 isoform 1-T1 [Sarcophilus harrisii]
MAPSQAPHCADWRLTWAVSSCRAGSQLPQGKAPYCGLGLRACAEICAFTFGLRLSSEPNFSPRLHRSPPWPHNQSFFGETADFLQLISYNLCGHGHLYRGFHITLGQYRNSSDCLTETQAAI